MGLVLRGEGEGAGDSFLVSRREGEEAGDVFSHAGGKEETGEGLLSVNSRADGSFTSLSTS